MVHSILDSGDLRISYGPNKWIINPSAVVKVSRNCVWGGGQREEGCVSVCVCTCVRACVCGGT